MYTDVHALTDISVMYLLEALQVGYPTSGDISRLLKIYSSQRQTKARYTGHLVCCFWGVRPR